MWALGSHWKEIPGAKLGLCAVVVTGVQGWDTLRHECRLAASGLGGAYARNLLVKIRVFLKTHSSPASDAAGFRLWVSESLRSGGKAIHRWARAPRVWDPNRGLHVVRVRHTLATGPPSARSWPLRGLLLVLAGMATVGWCTSQVQVARQKLSAPRQKA